jgi:hypothetical protein
MDITDNKVKFRAWNKKQGKMIYLKKDCVAIEFFRTGKWNIIDWSPESGKCLADNTNSILMISTGLKDKNNRKIFEGDIVKMDPGYFLKETTIEIRLRFPWFSFHAGKEDSGFSDDITKEGTIVGNIYEKRRK